MNDTASKAGPLTGPDTASTPRVGVGAIVTFVVLACALAWLVALPLWFGGGLAAPYATAVIAVMMYTPAIAMLFVMLVLRPVPKGQRLRFLGIWPLRPARRVVWLSVIGLFGSLAVIVVAMLVAVAFGWMTADFVGLSGFTQVLQATSDPAMPLPPTGVIVALQLLMVPVAAATINAVAAFGEEVGWRGFLVPALQRWGTAASLLISGVVWGLWHAPVILLGYNFGRTDLTGVLLMTMGCLMWGIVLGWLRLRSGSLWPAVFAHGAINAAGGLPALFFAAGSELDPALTGVLGASGWIVCAVVTVVLLLTGQFRRQPALAPSRRVRAGEPADA